MAEDKSPAKRRAKFAHQVIENWRLKSGDERTRFERMAQVYRSQYYSRSDDMDARYDVDPEDTTVENNYFFAFAETMAANISPQNPAVTITATKASDEKAAKFRTALVNKIFYLDKLAKKIRSMNIRAVVWPRVFLKAVWRADKERVTFRVINPHHVGFDMSAEDWEDIRYIFEATPITRSDFEQRMKRKGKQQEAFYRTDADEKVDWGKYPGWLEPEVLPKDGGDVRTSGAEISREDYEWTTIYEYYDLKNGVFYHFVEGDDVPVMESKLPYDFLKNPYHIHVFNDNLTDLGGLSDADLVAPTIDRLNEMDTLAMEHAKKTIPAIIIDEEAFDSPEEFVAAYSGIDGPGQAIRARLRPGTPVGSVLTPTPTPNLPGNWPQLRDQLTSTADFVLALPAYERGALNTSDVATELALSKSATDRRNEKRKAPVQELQEWAAMAVIALTTQFLDDSTELPVRLSDAFESETVMLTRASMGLGDAIDSIWSYTYEASAYDAAEQNDVVKVRQFVDMMPTLLSGLQTGIVDPRKFFTKLVELLNLGDILTDPKAAQPGMGMPAANQGGPGASAQGMMAQQSQTPEPIPGVASEALPAMQGGDVSVGAGDLGAAGLGGFAPMPGGG